MVYQHKLINVFEYWPKVDSILMDLSKVFSKVNQSLVIIAKLKAFWLSVRILSWTGSFLGNRVQFVRIDQHISRVIQVT